MPSTRRLLALLLGLTALLTLGVLPPDRSAAQGPKRGGILRVSYGNEIAHLDFHTAPGYENTAIRRSSVTWPPSGRSRRTG
jgi:hypothetical protein